MKKLLLATVSIILMLTFTACGGNGGDMQSTTTSNSVQTSEITTDNPVSTTSGTNGTEKSETTSTPQNDSTATNSKEPFVNGGTSNREPVTNSSPNGSTSSTNDKPTNPSTQRPAEPTAPPETSIPTEPDTPTSKILVAYFSATGTTKQIAEYAADILGADIYEIVPEDPYTDEDLDYYSGGRADQEQDDPTARPAISGSVQNIEQYDTVLLGYPIWHGQAPRIISTFLESYNFDGKTIVPFCTSHSSDIGSSAANLHSLAANANWLDGERFSSGTTREEIQAWLDSLGLISNTAAEVGVFNFDTHTVLLNSGYEMPIMGLGTYSLSDEECYNSVTALLEAGGRLIDT